MNYSKSSLVQGWLASIAGLITMILVFAYVGLKPELKEFISIWAIGYGTLLTALFAVGVIGYPFLIRSMNREGG